MKNKYLLILILGAIFNVFVFANASAQGWSGGGFNFNSGNTLQGWTLEGMFGNDGSGTSYGLQGFSSSWWDYMNYPSGLNGDPFGNNNGSYMMATGGTTFNPGSAGWGIMRFVSPNLASSTTWQNAGGYSVKIYESCTSPGDYLYANIYVKVYDYDLSTERNFFSGTAQQLTYRNWDTISIDWSGNPEFPTNYSITEVFVNIWGPAGINCEGQVWMDDVIPVALPASHTISGYVRTSGGAPIPGTSVTLNNGGGAAFTNLSGFYSVTVNNGWSGRATPSYIGSAFTPPYRDYTNVTSNWTNQNYTEVADPVTISGYVRTSSSVAIPGVQVNFSNGGGSATTNSSGFYSAVVNYGWSGTATPSLSGYSFSPVSRSYSNVTGNQSNQNYTGTIISETISGYIRTSSSVAIPGVLVNLSNGGGSATTNSSGFYSAVVNYGWSGTATPSLSGYTFSPVNRSYSNVTNNQSNQNYTGTLNAETISGYIRTASNAAIPGVLVTFSNGGGSVTTNSSGFYTANVNYGWSGTATPGLSGYTFSPVNRSYSNVTSNWSNQNFTGSLNAETISGYIRTGSNAAIPGVLVTFSNGGGSVTTNSNGFYSANVNYGWSGTATPSLSGYSFSPVSRSYSNVTANWSNQNFTGNINAQTISGYIRTAAGAAIPEVLVSFSNGGSEVTTNSSGFYSAVVNYGWSGSVTPSLSGLTFNPVSRSYSNVTANWSNQNFTGNINAQTISGYIRTAAGAALPGVLVSFTNNVGSATTNSNGFYSVNVIFGWSGQATPVLSGYTFNPIYRFYSNVSANLINQDFEGTFQSTPSTVPTNLAASDGDYTNRINVTWSGSADVSHYLVYRNTTNTINGAVAISSWQSGTTFSDNTATPGVTYYYWAQAAKSANGSDPSDFSLSNDGWRKLSPPANVSATDGTYGDRIDLSWNSVNGAGYYRVYRGMSADLISAVPISSWQRAQNYQDNGVTQGQLYYYWVAAAINSSGARASDYSAYDPGSTGGNTPLPPANLTAIQISQNQIELNWQDNSNEEIEFKIFRRMNEFGEWGHIATTPANLNYFVDSNLNPGTTYWYQILASNGTGDSSPSNTAFATTATGVVGDVIPDFVINAADINRVVDIILSRGLAASELDNATADCNGDGKINVIDLLLMVDKALVGLVSHTGFSNFNEYDYPVIGEMEFAVSELSPGTTFNMPVFVFLNEEVEAFQFNIKYDNTVLNIYNPVLSKANEKMTLAFEHSEDNLAILIYSSTGQKLLPGETELLHIPIHIKNGFSSDIVPEIEKLLLIGNFGKLFTVKVKDFTISPKTDLPNRYLLGQNYPNPFNPTTEIEYYLPESSYIRLVVYDVSGKEVVVLVDGQQDTGLSRATWTGVNTEGQNVPSGIYFYQLEMSGRILQTQKMILMK